MCDNKVDTDRDQRIKRLRRLKEDLQSRCDSLLQHSTRQLRKLCRAQGKNPSGPKEDLVERLLKDDNRACWRERYHMVEEDVVRLVGVERAPTVSWCTKQALVEGYFTVKGGLDGMIYDFDCPTCHARGEVTLRDLLFQPDLGLQENASAFRGAFQCQHCHHPSFVTGMCVAQPRLVESQEHSHCRLCYEYGVCLPDRSWVHCKLCSNHFEGHDDGIVCDHGTTAMQCRLNRLVNLGYSCKEMHG